MFKITPEREEKRRAAIKLAWRGYTQATISRWVGVPERTVSGWLVGVTPDKEGRIPCPECGGKMEKQPLYFWQCSCGAEYWPPAEFVPEDPAQWNLPWGLNIPAEVAALLIDLAREHKSYEEIAATLNSAGYTTFQGKPWTKKTVHNFIFQYGISTFSDDRGRIVELIRVMALDGYNCTQIADQLNIEGYSTKFGLPWNNNNVLHVVRAILPDLEMTQGHPGIPKRARKEEKPEDWVHPWRLDETKRVLAIQRGHGRNDMSNMSS